MIDDTPWDQEDPPLPAAPREYNDVRLHRPAEVTVKDDVTRAFPHALGPEKSVLSSMLQDPQEYIAIALEERLSEEHFYLPSHSTLYAVLIQLSETGEEIELVSLVQKLLDRGKLDSIGGPSALTDLYTYAPSPGHFRHHAQFLREKYILRGIISASNEAIAGAYDAPEEVMELLDATESKLSALRGGSVKSSGVRSAREGLVSVISELEDLIRGKESAAGLSTGFEVLDAMGQLKPGEMFVVAARPSMGKTGIMMNIVERICVDAGNPTLVFSAEMTLHQVMARIAYTRAKFPQSELKVGMQPDKGELMRIRQAFSDVSRSPLWVDDTTGISINELRSKARRKHREVGLKFLAIDYLQLLRSTSKQASNSREREIGEISAGIKGLAKELGIPILLLAQLNRESEKRTGTSRGIPRMSDLRESGNIEQDADKVGLLHRAEYFAEDEAEKQALAGQAQLILAKNRAGATGSVPLTWIADLMRFESHYPAQGELPGTKQTPTVGSRYGH